MNISKNSWHYKLVKNTFTSSKGVPHSLCPYVRAVLGRVLFFGWLATMLGGMASVAMHSKFIALGVPSILAYVASFFATGALAAVIVGVVVGFIFGGLWLTSKIDDWRESRKDAKIEKEREDRLNGIEPKPENIVIAFIKAKHNKFCPHISFTKE